MPLAPLAAARSTRPWLLAALGLVLAGAAHGQAKAPPRAAAAAAAPSAATAPAERPKPTRNPAFYRTELTLSSANAAETRGATMRALGQVLVRLTGNPQAPANPTVRRAGANLDALVVESNVRQEQETVNGMPVYRSVLSVSFDPDNVDALIAAAGLRFWTSTRPKPILWLAIDDGRGPRLVTGQQTKVVKPLADRGLERGMRYLLPAGTSVEQAAVQSIWALNVGALQPLTARYRNDAQLVGKVYRKPPGWAADWVLNQAGAELARWSFADADPRRVIASGVDEGANAIAKRDAVMLDTGASGPQAFEVDGVRSQADYLRLVSYLQGLPMVRRVQVVEARPDSLRLQVDLAVGLRAFLPIVAGGDVLLAGETSAGVTHFSLR
jgi:uncharacterized protein